MSRNARLALAAGLVVVIIAGVVVFFTTDDDTEVEVTASTTTSTVETTTTAPIADTTAAMWPWTDSTVRYTDPVAAATGFATDFVGFVDPVVGEFQPDASSPSGPSGEVDVRMKPGLTPTTVQVRQLGTDGTWWVVGASTPNIQVVQPTAGQVVASPIVVRGTSTAFEGTVAVDIREDGNPNPISVNGYVMGGANGELGPFDDTVTFGAPSAQYGAVVFRTNSAENGQVFEATIVRVRFS